MMTILQLVLLQGLLRVVVQEAQKLDASITTLEPTKTDLHRAFVTVSQVLDKEINRRAPTS